jgi:hypothetical protein
MGMPLRAVWTIGSSAAPSAAAAAVSTSVLDDNYETCLGRLYSKCVEIEVYYPTTVINNNFKIGAICVKIKGILDIL